MPIESVHPYYAEKLPQWIEAFDFYRGGQHVLFPRGRRSGAGLRLDTISTAQLDAPVEGQGERDVAQRHLLRAAQDISYLFAHARESKRGYMDRIARSVHFPVLRHCVDAFASATLRTAPTYSDEVKREPWVSYHNDVDRRGTNMGQFVRQALTYALFFGLEFAVTDKMVFADEVFSRAQQLDRGERAFSYLVNPLDVLDWQVNQDSGQFDWLKIREPYTEPRMPTEEHMGTGWQYRIWYPTGWELYRKEQGSKDYVVTEGDHPCNGVPVSVCYARQSYESRFDIAADAMLADAVYVDREIFNDMSLLREQIVGQVFSQLFLPDDGTNQWAGVDIGVGVAVPYNSEHGQPLMLSPDSGLITAQMQLMESKLQMLKQSLGLGRGQAEYSKEERSAQALTVESRNENNQVASLAASAEEFDISLHRHVAAYEGESIYPVAAYSRDVSLRSISAQLQDVMSLKTLGVPPQALVELLRPLVVQTMAEQGSPKGAVAKAMMAMDMMVQMEMDKMTMMEEKLSGSSEEEHPSS